MLWIQEVEMVDSVDDLKSSRSIQGYDSCPAFWDTGREDCILSEQDHPEFLYQEKVSLEERKAQKEDRFFRGRQIAHMICDDFPVVGAQDTVLGYADLFSNNLRIDDVQEFDTRLDEILLSMSKIPPDDILESLYTLRICESDQLKTVFELYMTLTFIRRYRSPIIKNCKRWWKET